MSLLLICNRKKILSVKHYLIVIVLSLTNVLKRIAIIKVGG